MKCKNKIVTINGVREKNNTLVPMEFTCVITNDNIGKTLSIGDGDIMFHMAFEQIEKYLTGDYCNK